LKVRYKCCIFTTWRQD